MIGVVGRMPARKLFPGESFMWSVQQNTAEGRARLKLVIFLFVLLAGAIVFQQYSAYLKQSNSLAQNNELSRQRLNMIVDVIPEQEAFRKKLAVVTKRYDTLRRLLPAEEQLDSFKRGVNELIEAKGLKVDAERVTQYSRPFYHEIRLSYSLKGSGKAVQQVFAKVKREPRLVLSTGPEKDSFENTGLALSIFSVPPKEEENKEDLDCHAKPQGVWFPFLKEELAALYDVYLLSCKTVLEHEALYRDIRRYRYLSEEVQYLETVRDTIVNSK